MNATTILFTHLSRGQLLGGQEGGEATLQTVRTSADGVRRVTIVRALPMEAQVIRWGHEERFQEFTVRFLIEFCGHV